MAEPPQAGPGGPPTGQPQPGYVPNKRLQQTQAQVDEVVDIMRVNVEKVLERDQKLTELDDRADQLQVQSRQFQQTSSKVRRKYFWKNIKMWIILIGVVLVIIIIIIVYFVATKDNNKQAPTTVAPPPATTPKSSK